MNNLLIAAIRAGLWAEQRERGDDACGTGLRSRRPPGFCPALPDPYIFLSTLRGPALLAAHSPRSPIPAPEHHSDGVQGVLLREYSSLAGEGARRPGGCGAGEGARRHRGTARGLLGRDVEAVHPLHLALVVRDDGS